VHRVPCCDGDSTSPHPLDQTGSLSPPPARREVVLATMHDGSKLVGMLPAPGTHYAPGSVQLMPGQIVVEVGKMVPWLVYVDEMSRRAHQA
jgi:hypothetical protein